MTRFPASTRLSRALLGPAAVAAALGLGTLPAAAQTLAVDCSAIHFDLANPSAGSELSSGSLVLQGVAMDTRARTGSGIDRIDFFLDNRDQGGLNLGSVSPDTSTAPFGTDSFQTTVSIPNLIGGHDLFAYAHSSVTGQESVIDVPVVLGEDPSKVNLTGTQGATPSTTESCTNASGMETLAAAPTTTTSSGSSSASTSPMAPAVPAATTVSPSNSTITFDVGNPSAGDTVHVGAMVVQGVAMDRAAHSGPGVERVDIFLDDRDQGGILLGQAPLGSTDQWQATITIPTNQTGMHTIFFYAHSTVNGDESAVSVPVTVAP